MKEIFKIIMPLINKNIAKNEFAQARKEIVKAAEKSKSIPLTKAKVISEKWQKR